MSTEDQNDDVEREGGEAEDRLDAAHDEASTSAPAEPVAKPGSAGARLAAAKAAKAAAKAAAKKAREAANAQADGEEIVVADEAAADPTEQSVEAIRESAVGQAATRATEWASANRNIAVGVAAAVGLGVIGFAGYSWWNTSRAHAAGGELQSALEITNATIGTRPPTASADAPHFDTRDERAEAALEAYQRVVQNHAGTQAANWALLGEARSLFDLGRYEDARGAYERVLREAGRDPILAWRALEGIGFTYEAAEQWREAIARYEELRSIDDGAFQAPADYHIARMRIALGETVQATTTLRELVNTLRAESSGGETAFPYVLQQAEVRLRELDPSSVSSPMVLPGGGAGGLPPGLEGIDPQVLEQLRRQLEQQGAGE